MKDAAEVKRGRKYDQVVEGAATVFMRTGFEGASVDEIAQEAGVSKATLYSYFSDKRLLFIEVARREIARQADMTLSQTDHGADARTMMTRFGMTFGKLILSPFGMSIMRVVIAEAERFPEIGQAFYESGPNLMVAGMTAYFETAEARGELSIPDKRLAAHQFVELCKADCHLRAMMGVGDPIDENAIAYVVGEAVEMFLARYGTA